MLSLILGHFDLLYLPGISFPFIITYLFLEITHQEITLDSSNNELSLLECFIVSITTVLITASTLLIISPITSIITMCILRVSWKIIYKRLSTKIIKNKKKYNIKNKKTKKEGNFR